MLALVLAIRLDMWRGIGYELEDGVFRLQVELELGFLSLTFHHTILIVYRLARCDDLSALCDTQVRSDAFFMGSMAVLGSTSIFISTLKM